MKSWILLLLPTVVAAECVLQDRVLQRSEAVISERSQLRSEVVPSITGGRKCMVSYRARIGTEWHSAFGEHEWPGDRPREEACARALAQADEQVRQRVGRAHSVGEKVLICSDNPDLKTLRQTNPGTIGKLAQFRPHPDRARLFWHNGAQCRYFLDSQFTGADIHTWQGIICQLQGDAWVVVDKF